MTPPHRAYNDLSSPPSTDLHSHLPSGPTNYHPPVQTNQDQAYQPPPLPRPARTRRDPTSRAAVLRLPVQSAPPALNLSPTLSSVPSTPAPVPGPSTAKSTQTRNKAPIARSAAACNLCRSQKVSENARL
ncbi:hypothetical protein CROQUDRAFT_658738 [Cronartium quercuum f. sp. fusiforme G11]|uniref:Uncharacterized protein n=1 Tax=Cronartium quercuum f. sp. fusiforme G11 TaxID=708437 RepID=A0A9P6NG50_9BASI|nr:hypothetical protein CROQUDRAFT_658738 [Cronartium quercuum f. sp. fusiforme G11]